MERWTMSTPNGSPISIETSRLALAGAICSAPHKLPNKRICLTKNMGCGKSLSIRFEKGKLVVSFQR